MIPVYLVQASASIQVGASTSERLQTAARAIDVRRTAVRLLAGSAPLDIDIWGDEEGRLLRVTIPAQNLDVVREDIASVSTRRVTVSRPNDESVTHSVERLLACGNALEAGGADGDRLPAVVLVGGSGPTDRDELVFGIPVLGELANALADAGFLVVRYDKRGVGQSGGRVGVGVAGRLRGRPAGGGQVSRAIARTSIRSGSPSSDTAKAATSCCWPRRRTSGSRRLV